MKEHNDDTLAALNELKAMLAEEAPRWDHSKKSKTAEQISRFEVVLPVFIQFVQEDNPRAFVVALAHYALKANDICKCFIKAEKKRKAKQLWNDAVMRTLSSARNKTA